MHRQEYKNTWHCFKTIYQREGIRVMFSGLNATLLRAFPTNAATCTLPQQYFSYQLVYAVMYVKKVLENR